MNKKIEKKENEIEDLLDEISLLEDELEEISYRSVHRPYPKTEYEKIQANIEFHTKFNISDTIKILKLKHEILLREIELIQYHKQLSDLDKHDK